MFRIRGSPGTGLLAIVLLLTIIGLANLNSNDKPINYRAPAHNPRQGSIHNDRPGPRGLQYAVRDGRHPPKWSATRSASVSATRTSYPQPTPTCYMPGLLTPWYDVDVNELCKCDSYMWDDGSALSNAGWYGGRAICGARCVPQISNQTRLVNEASGSFSECIGACSGSFEKAKMRNKRQADGYWFCHGVNFKKGELCEFIGAIQYPDFTGNVTESGQCWDNGLTPGG